MPKNIHKFIFKILALSSLMVIVFNVWNNIINADKNNTTTQNITKNENNSNFKNINNSSLWKTWVAITTNIWIRYKQRVETPATIYKDIFSINEILKDTNTANKELIGSNMIIIDEYRNVLKTNVKQLIDSSLDKPRMLNALIDQLEYRYVSSIESIKNLNEQKDIFETSMKDADSKINTLKQKIEQDFKNNDANESLANINTYLELKKQYYYANTYIVYINHFLSEYIYLNEYNKRLLDTLINNKEALIKNTYIVIPDTWSEVLKDFNLLYDEAEFKAKQEK